MSGGLRPLGTLKAGGWSPGQFSASPRISGSWGEAEEPQGLQNHSTTAQELVSQEQRIPPWSAFREGAINLWCFG